MSSQVLGSLSFLDTPDVNGALVLTSATGLAQGNIAGTAGAITVTGTTNLVINLASNAVLPGLAGIVIPSGTTGQRPGSPSTGTLRYNTTDGNAEIYGAGIWQPFGQTLQTIVGNIPATTGTGNKTSTTVPLVTEGIPILSQVLTPKISGSTILIQFSVTLSSASNNARVYVAVFAGSTCIGMAMTTITPAAVTTTIPMQCAFVAPSTAAITFSARTGTISSNTAHFVNQSSASVSYGGALSLDFRLTEFA